MKKTFTINISGTIFHIEEDAYEKLQGYLLKLKTHFGNGAEGREIVADIESRISELFLEKSRGDNKIIVMEWVEEMIVTMGTPEDFIRQEGEEEKVAAEALRGKRRLYRDPDNRVIAGVCSGLGAYFNIDPVVMRILFVVLLFGNGIGLIAYLVLWVAVPRAQNSAQRLEMRGREVNISNIERTIREDSPEGKVTAPGTDVQVVAAPKTKRTSGDNVLYDIMKGVFKIAVIVLGIVLIVTGFMGLLGFISTLVVGQTFLSDWPLVWSPKFQVPDLLSHFVTPAGLSWGLLSLTLLAGIPFLAMLFVGTKMVFRYKSNNSVIGMGMVGVWLLALLALIIVSAREIGHYKSENSLSGSETLYPAKEKTYRLSLAPDKFSNYGEVCPDLDIERVKFIRMNGENLLLGEPRLDIVRSSTGDCVLVVDKSSRGKTSGDASDQIQKIVYHYQATDSTLIFDPWFLVGDKQEWRDQQVKLTLKIPEGISLYLDEGMQNIVDDIDTESNIWERDMIGKTWIMLPGGLAEKDSLKTGIQ